MLEILQKRVHSLSIIKKTNPVNINKLDDVSITSHHERCNAGLSNAAHVMKSKRQQHSGVNG